MAKKKSTKAAKAPTPRSVGKKKAASSGSTMKPKATGRKAAKKKTKKVKAAAEKVPPKKGFEIPRRQRRSTFPQDCFQHSAAEKRRIKEECGTRWNELCRQRIEAENALEKWWPELQQLPWVTGAHVGLKRTKGKFAFPLRYCIRVHVSKKLPEKALSPSMRLPDYYNSIDVDLWEANYRSLAGCVLPNHFEPVLLGGIAIAPKSDPCNWGTLGFCVQSKGEAMLLTNHHVARSQNDIIQPPSANTPQGSAVVGSVERSVNSASVDAAIIRPNGSRATSRSMRLGDGLLPGTFEEGELTYKDVDDGESGVRTLVFKIGAASGGSPSLPGVVKSINATPRVPGVGDLQNQIIVHFSPPQVTGGDSGSLLVKQVQKNGQIINQVVGLVIAEIEGGAFLVANHWKNVRDSLRIDL
jgi:hypothetical protein